MIVMMNLASDFDELVTGQLQKNGFVTSAAHNPYLRFATLYARTERSVPQIKYSMLVSTELQGNPQFQLLQPVINEIAATLAEGGAVLPYLSRMASDPNSQRDGLLAYWGIHHLHLSSISTIDAKGHVTRADYLLFVRFEGGIAHFIDILPHANRNAFVDTALIEIVDKNWPHLHMELNRVTGHILTESEISSLRKANVNAALLVNGRTVMPKMGIMADGHSIEVIRLYDYIGYELDNLERNVRLWFHSYFMPQPPYAAYVKLVTLDDKSFTIREQISGQEKRVLRQLKH